MPFLPAALRRTFRRSTARHLLSRPTARPSLEALESRLVPYALSGNAWANPQLITISFVPDGTLMTSGPNGNVYSDLFDDDLDAVAERLDEVARAAAMYPGCTRAQIADLDAARRKAEGQ